MSTATMISLLAITAGVGGALAAGVGLEDAPAHGATLVQLRAEEVQAHAGAAFARADVNADGYLRADDYAALAIATAELARLNGFVVLETGGTEETIALSAAGPNALRAGERARIDASARRDFYAMAGADSLLSVEEFFSASAARFTETDSNRDGRLAAHELIRFAEAEARIASDGV